MSTITYVDACLLIAAYRGQDEIAERALEILDDPDREYAASEFLRLEVVPKPTYHNRTDEVEFYDAFFSEVRCWARDLEGAVRSAMEEAKSVGLSAVDALHVASAAQVGADELVTAEKPTKLIHRATLVKVVGIRPA